jgi:4-amino-4-deoxy-L-arabinose transferase-like glycosyltransferase
VIAAGRIGWPRDFTPPILAASAFVLRLVVRLVSGEDDFLRHGYTLYVALARTFLRGDGLCLSATLGCARRMPLYPLLIAPMLATGHLFPWLPVVQSAIGAVTVWVAWKITLDLTKNRRAAIAAATCAALNPYAVVHDTALQETALFNLLLAVAIYQLLRLRRNESPGVALGAGIALGLAMLTTGRIEIFLLSAVAWGTCRPTLSSRRRYQLGVLIAAPLFLLVGGWALRNFAVVGAPVLSTEVGKNLWVGNNEWTFSHFPRGSIDLSQAESFKALSAARRAALTSTNSEVDRDRLERSWAIEYATEHPLLVTWGAIRKVWSALSAQFTPERGRVIGLLYRVIFVPVHVLGAMGLWRLRGDRQAASLIALLLVSFTVTTAIFWSHTSHKSSLDVVFFACTASLLAPGVKARGAPAPTHGGSSGIAGAVVQAE